MERKCCQELLVFGYKPDCKAVFSCEALPRLIFKYFYTCYGFTRRFFLIVLGGIGCGLRITLSLIGTTLGPIF